jgi:hypothetical protein
MADAADAKSVVRKGVWVRLPPPKFTLPEYQPKSTISANVKAFLGLQYYADVSPYVIV